MSDYVNNGVDKINATLGDIKGDLTTLRPMIKNLKLLVLGSFSTQSGSGGVVSTTIGADNVPVKSLSVGITAVQSGSGDPSPTNIRPITGWSGANVYVSPTLDAQDGTTYPISFGDVGTVYGGTLNVTTGKLIVNWVDRDLSVDTSWSEQTWSGKDANAHYFRGSGFGGRRYGGSTSDVYGMCDSYKWWGNGTTTTLRNLSNLEFGYQGTNSYVWIRDDAYTTAADFKTSLAGKHLVYELETPLEYDLTPIQVRTLLGENNIWAECGNTACEYRIDRTLYLNTL